VRSCRSSVAEDRTATAVRLAIRALRTRGAGYADLAEHLAQDVRAFVSGRVPLAGARVLDLGSGHGSAGGVLVDAGAWVTSVDLRPMGGVRPVIGDATRLPFGAGAFDGVVCANLLEHVPSPPAVIAEIARVLRRGGWLYLSWTPWYGPLGGHEYSPWHYLGVRPARAIGRYARIGGGRNVPGTRLFPTHVGRTLRGIRRTGGFEVRYAGPRYWPSQAWLVRVPGLREVATWNCLLFLERR
jgi:SAM-dependent methyltransferase